MNGGGDASSFEQCYRCYPVTFIEKAHLEKGDKIIMPPSALDRLASLHIEYPMLFQLSNVSVEKTSHCGVLEFTADEGFVYLPYWMMLNMSLQEGDILQVKNISLVKGTYIKLQPHTQDFLDISNPKAILETTLRSYSCLTTGDTIMVPYNNKQYFINVIEAKPSSAVSIIETDCEVDFALPLDYKEPEKPQMLTPSNKRTREVGEEEPTSKVPKFTPFTGSGKRLDGKAQPQTESEDTKQEKPTETGKDDEKLSVTTPRQRSGKLVFGSNSKPAAKETVKVDPKNIEQESTTKSDEAKFQVFTGKKYSLKG
ncbi:PREDICTED: ubiquitin fusion degradation protein 1 homolog [Camelina sativa]|uniref:Ubiquitin fusion degradation protein 1 homolog n=1 Tax=Camelina sativa TaxID=90675 RepID=A0ABM0WEN6_CAMSA|nr:PREDICTED: ubiquitin fusion degradation protein 1 homolog [Camelina sativa]XP_010469997.1 PREDICTED: ubiquitin fusion degradation protein 1 homolog [Camelina sativa]XP_010469998.1 PREDICTED: ubiquitin fusion degradation protein 1 homolog [Camelina sativa]